MQIYKTIAKIAWKTNSVVFIVPGCIAAIMLFLRRTLVLSVHYSAMCISVPEIKQVHHASPRTRFRLLLLCSFFLASLANSNHIASAVL